MQYMIHWLVIARPQGALGIGSPVGHFTGTREDFGDADRTGIYSRGLELCFPPLIPARFGGEYYQPPYGAEPGVTGGSIIGPMEARGSLRYLDLV